MAIKWYRALWRSMGDIGMLLLLIPVAFAVGLIAFIWMIGYFPIWWWRRGKRG